MAPKYSIIIATYNSALTLNDSIESVLNQTEKDLELIIIDGNSNDSTIQIISEYSSQISFWASDDDRGVYDAWNKGLEQAEGDWIIFLGSDDVLLPEALSSISACIDSNEELDFISAKKTLVDENLNYIKVVGKPWNWSVFRRYMCIAHPGAAHHKSLFKLYGSFDLDFKNVADYEFLLRPGKNLRAGYLNKSLVLMRTGGMSYSFTSIWQTMKVKGHHKTRDYATIILEMIFASFKLCIKKVIWP